MMKRGKYAFSSREALHFTLSDLRVAMTWASAHPSARLRVVTDHSYLPEAIHISSPGSTNPRWCIWRDYPGRIYCDDWQKSEFDLPYPTVQRALDFIASRLQDLRAE